MTCKHCNGNPPNQISMFENTNGSALPCQPMRYKMCDYCKKVDTLNYLDRFYNSTMNRVLGSYFWKVARSEEKS